MAQLIINSKQWEVDLVAFSEPRRQLWRVPSLGGQVSVIPGKMIPGNCMLEIDPASPIDTGQQAILIDDDGRRWSVVTESINVNITTSSAIATISAVVFGSA